MLPRFRQGRWLYLCLLCLFYFSFNGTVGVIWAGDSSLYLAGSVRVSPLYPLLLRLFRSLFSEAAWPWALIVFQQALLAYAIFSFTDMLERAFHFRWYWRAACCLWLAFMFYAFRLVAIGMHTETFFCNAVLTEGVAYPLYLLFFKYYFLALREKDGRCLLYAAAFAFLLTGTRGQFYWLLIALFIGFVPIRRQGMRRPWLKALGVGAAYAVLTLGLSVGYHYLATGVPTGTTLGTEVMLSTVLYDCGDDAGAADFLPEGSEERAVLSATLETSIANGWTSGAAEGDWIERYRHYEEWYDSLRMTFLEEIARFHGEASYEAMPQELLAESVGRYSRLLPRLIADHLGAYARARGVNALIGLIRSNATLSPAGAALSAAAYLVGIGLLLFTRRQTAYADARRFLKALLMCILLNTLFCCFGVFPLSRYMYYNFPLFYIGLLLFIPSFFNGRQERAGCRIDVGLSNMLDSIGTEKGIG
ncbi:MAG: hypothetical protein Q4C13_05435, partial [Clostridia bacterium]|nr:hypothetical protein [Clostridia bacterium]